MQRERANASRPRLLIVAPSAYPFGGVATWLDGLVAGLRAREWRVDVALLAGAHHDVERYLERHPLGEVARVANPTGSREGRQQALARAIAASAADLVLAVNVGDVEDAVARLRRSRDAPRLVTSQHGLQSDFYAHLRSKREIVDGVIVTNRLGVELARELGEMPAERIAYAPYGVEVGAPAAAAPAGAPLGIVWAGRFEQAQKRVGDLPAICERLGSTGVDFTLELAGSGPEAASLFAELAPFERAGRVRRLGEVAADEMRRVAYAGRHVLLVTSSWETGPLVAWEALVAGLAVVSSRFLGSGLEAALRHEETALLFPVGDAAAAATELSRARDETLRRRLVAAGRAEVAARYSATASLDAWETALLRLGALPRRPAPTAPESSPAGRLDRWLGVSGAERARRALRIRHRQASPGAEWPHALSGRAGEAEFLRRAAELDRSRPAAAAESCR